MSGSKVILHLHGDSFARRYQVASHAITAAAAGDEVLVVLWFEALRRFVREDFDAPLPGEDAGVAGRARELGLPAPSELLREARGLGARVVACETAVRLAGLGPEEAAARLDALPGLQELLTEEKAAALVLYV